MQPAALRWVSWRVLIILGCILRSGALAIAADSIVIENLVRHVDLKSHIAAVTQAVVLRNRGSENVEFTYAVVAKTRGCPHPGRVSAHTKKQDLLLEKVAPPPNLHFPKLNGDIDSGSIGLYKVPLALKSGETLKYNLRYICGRSLRPFPRKRAFHETHTVIYSDYEKTPAAYSVLSQHIRIYLPSRNPIGLVNVTRTQQPGVYETSPVRESTAYDFGFYPAIKIHYVYNHHLGVFHNVKRRIDVSLRGNLNIQEAFEFENEAAELAEEYSRTAVTRFIKGTLGRRTARGYPPHRTCFQLEAVLPPKAFAIEFFDAIGNVSTSNARRREKDVLLQLEPRYPVLGGWKSDWFLEYKLPTESAVTVSPAASSSSDVLYHVQFPIGHAIRETFTQSLKCEIIFPQEARNIELTAPYPLKDLRVSASHWGWLDIFQARPVVSFSVEGFAPSEESSVMTDQIKITYQSSTGWSQFKKFFCCQIAAFAPLALYMVAKRLYFRTFTSKAEQILAFNSSIGIERVGLLVKNLELVAQSSYEQLLTASNASDISNISQTWKNCRDSIMLDISQAVATERDAPSMSPALRSVIRLADPLCFELLATIENAISTIDIKKHKFPSTVAKRWNHVRLQCQEFQKTILSLPSQLPSATDSPSNRR